jgi:Zn-dependent membrane protease YugP
MYLELFAFKVSLIKVKRLGDNIFFIFFIFCLLKIYKVIITLSFVCFSSALLIQKFLLESLLFQIGLSPAFVFFSKKRLNILK